MGQLLMRKLRSHPESRRAEWQSARMLPLAVFKNNPTELSTAVTAARVARCARDRNHGGDNRGIVRERGHPQGGPHQPQDRGGEDRYTKVLCN